MSPPAARPGDSPFALLLELPAEIKGHGCAGAVRGATETAPVDVLRVIPAAGGETCDSCTVAVVARAPLNISFARTLAIGVLPVLDEPLAESPTAMIT